MMLVVGVIPESAISLPEPSDPAYDEAAAEALLEGARSGDTGSAESATGYYWGEKKASPVCREHSGACRARWRRTVDAARRKVSALESRNRDWFAMSRTTCRPVGVFCYIVAATQPPALEKLFREIPRP